MDDEQEGTMHELATQEPRPQTMKLTANEIRADVNLIQEVLQAVMKKDVHYGIIPGTPKPTLYKPGAEKIMATFRLAAKPIIEDLSTPDEIRYRVSVMLTHQITGTVVGYGVGEASSNETKYKWVGCKFPDEFDATPEDRRRVIWKSGREKPYQVKQVRANVSDVANTVLKMAKKRALVDGVLTCTAASDTFDQDIEDLPEGLQQTMAENARPPMPQRASEKAKQAPPPAATPPPPAKQETRSYDDGEDNTDPQDPEPPAQRSMLDKTDAREMDAKFDAPCKGCSKLITKGSRILYIGSGVDKGAYHARCAA